MGLGHKRADLRANAEGKLRDASILLSCGSYSNAYYIGGYAVELGLKACIASQMAADTIPSKDILRGVLDHNFQKLVGLAGLTTELKRQQDREPAFGANWAIVAEWSPDVRYEIIPAMSAQLLIEAIADENNGVLTWIKNYW